MEYLQFVNISGHLCLCLLAFLALSGSALAQQADCRVEPFQGATSPQGAVARMRVVNTGSACLITNYGVPSERRNPADAGRITREPAHGKSEFVAPHARYTPAKGYAGEDEFEYEALAHATNNQRIRLKVQVKVLVVAP